MFRFAVLAGVSLVGLSATAQAQEAAADEGASPVNADEIVVTGTLVRGIAPPGANVIGVTAQAIQETGATSTAQLLQTIPQLGSFNSVQTPVGGFGTVTTNRPNLRNLPGDRTSGSSPTLVLVDGHRVVGAGISVTSPDPDIVPPALIERVEIVPDGGSAIYGSDAVAGVVNFITKKRFDGAELNAHYGFADNYFAWDVNATVGKAWDTGSIFLSYNFAKNDMVRGGDRDWVFMPPTLVSGNQVISLRCSPGNVAVGNFALPGAPAQIYQLPFVPGTSVPGVTNQCDETDENTIFPAQRRHSLMAGLTQDLTDSLTFDVRAFYTNRRIESILGPNRASNSFTNLASLYPLGFFPFPAGTPQQYAGGPLSGFESQTVYYQWGANDAMRHVNKLETWGVSPTVKVKLDDNWQLRVLASYGESVAEFRGSQADSNAVNNAIRYGVLNPYNIAATDPTVLAMVSNFEQYYHTKQRQFDLRAVVDGDLFSLPGGAVKLAFGAEYLAEGFYARFGTKVRGTEDTGFAGYSVGGNVIIPAYGPVPQNTISRNVKSLFGELVIPIFGAENATAAFQELTLSAAGRYDKYSDFGGTFNPKFGITWKPVDWVKLRGAWGKSFVAPSLADDPRATGGSANFVNIPTFLPDASLIGKTINGTLVPPAGGRSQLVVLGNKPGIESQKATTWSVGIDLDPPFVPGLKLGVTYWNIDYSPIIALPPFTDATFYSSFSGTSAVIFNPTTEQINEVLATPGIVTNGTNCGGNNTPTPNQGCYVIIDARKQNLARTKVSGLDFLVSYFRETGFGSVDLSINANYELSRDLQPTVFVAFQDQLAFNNSRFRSRVQVGAQIDRLRAQVAWNHSHGYNLNPAVGVGTTQTRVDSFNVVDLFFKYDFRGEGAMKDLSLTLNVNNVFDQDPPVFLKQNGLTIQANGFANGQTLGRLIQFGFNKKF